jgi:predicted dehydrogenase
MPKNITAAVVGCGVIAPEHIKDYQQLDGVKVKWVCDLVRSKAEDKARTFKVPNVSADVREVLADPEVTCISICTDHASHSAIAVAALEAGKDVLCEKALAHSAAGLDAMLAAHQRLPERVFGAVFQHRFDAAHRYLKRLIDDGSFGAILTCNVQLCCLRTDAYYQSDKWRGTWAEEGGSALINQSIHYIDTVAWVMGGVAEVSGAWANRTHQKVIQTEDTAVAALCYSCGALGTISATVSSHLEWEPLISLRGSLGSIDLRNATPAFVDFKDPAVRDAVTAGFAAARDVRADAPVKQYYGPSHATLIADFVEAVRARRPPFVTAESARHAVDIVLAVYQSQRSGMRVELTSRP